MTGEEVLFNTERERLEVMQRLHDIWNRVRNCRYKLERYKDSKLPQSTIDERRTLTKRELEALLIERGKLTEQKHKLSTKIRKLRRTYGRSKVGL